MYMYVHMYMYVNVHMYMYVSMYRIWGCPQFVISSRMHVAMCRECVLQRDAVC